MALPSSGQITLNQVNVELGLTATAQIGMNDSAVRGLFGIASGEIEMSDGYGKSSETVLSADTNRLTVSSLISAGGTLRVPSNLWVWSSVATTPAMIIDIACTVIIEGKVVGMGGSSTHNGQVGGTAISITSSGVTVQNNSGAYIAGGGGSGALGSNGFGGGGAGGGKSFSGSARSLPFFNGTGNNGITQDSGKSVGGTGGGAGGGGGSSSIIGGDGAQGGFILPGSGGAGGYHTQYGGASGGTGGSAGGAGAAGQGPSPYFGGQRGGGGGGGWGASGGSGGSGGPGAGGDAIDDNGNSYTLTNNGTIYGAT